MAKATKIHIFNEIRKSAGNLTFRTRKNKVIDMSKKKKPRQPNTSAQARNKWKYGYLIEQFRKLSDEDRQYYEELAKKRNLTAWNVYVQENFNKKIDEQFIATYCNSLDEYYPDSVEITTGGCCLLDELGYRTYATLKFPPISVWTNGVFNTAQLTIHVYDASFFDDTLTKLYIYPITTDYDVHSITWNNPPPYLEDIYVYAQLYTDMTLIQLDISTMLNELSKRNLTLFGLLLKPVPDNADNIYEFCFDTPDMPAPPNIYINWQW